MSIKKIFGYDTRNLIRAIAVVIAFAFVALSLTGCGDGSDDDGGTTVKYPDWMVKIPAGTFTMGSSDTQDFDADPPHQVTLTSFYMGKTEVTQKQWYEVMGTTIQELQTAAAPTNNTNYGQGDNYPVYYVSWYDVIVFCNKLSVLEGLTPAYSIEGETDPDEWGTVPTSWDADSPWNSVEIAADSNGYRLPTEAQWEYACRAGTTSPWHSGETSDNLGDYAWYSGNNGESGTETYGTKQVSTKSANAFGLYDMSGNVWEWCWDWFDVYTEDPQTDPVGASSGSYRVARGGSWGNPARSARSA